MTFWDGIIDNCIPEGLDSCIHNLLPKMAIMLIGIIVLLIFIKKYKEVR